MAEDWIYTQVPGGAKQTFGDAPLYQKRTIQVMCLHTTETSSFPNYGKGKAPHVTIHPSARQFRQHVPLSQAAFALVAPSGYSTNTWGVLQAEVVGFAGQPDAYTQGDLDYIGQVVRAMIAGRDVPMTSSVHFVGDEAYGTGGAVRLSVDAWQSYRGFLGHQHVPGNSHWDPGAININAWLAAISPAPAPQEGDMASLVSINGPGGQTAVYNETIGWTDCGPRGNGVQEMYVAIATALGFTMRVSNVDANGWEMAKNFKVVVPVIPPADVDEQAIADAVIAAIGGSLTLSEADFNRIQQEAVKALLAVRFTNA